MKKEKAKCITLATLKQNNEAWHLERSKRITGCICYQLYTYMKNNHNREEWDLKLDSILKFTFKGQYPTRHRERMQIQRSL